MTRGVREGKITSAALKTLLKLDAKDKTKYQVLLEDAYRQNLIDEETFNSSLPTTDSTVKCYLYSLITDTNIRNKIETYVLNASELYSRGSFLANLIAIDVLGEIGEKKKATVVVSIGAFLDFFHAFLFSGVCF